MIKSFVDTFMNHKQDFEALLSKHPQDYAELVKGVVGVLAKYHEGYEKPDYTKIHEIDDGNYQGTLVYVIPCTGYQPSTYWTTKVDYGSCSGCDTLEGIREYSDSKPDESQIKQYMTLYLHLIQQMKEI